MTMSLNDLLGRSYNWYHRAPGQHRQPPTVLLVAAYARSLPDSASHVHRRLAPCARSVPGSA
eukprot:40562-Rhodomonas_salina.4